MSNDDLEEIKIAANAYYSELHPNIIARSLAFLMDKVFELERSIEKLNKREEAV